VVFCGVPWDALRCEVLERPNSLVLAPVGLGQPLGKMCGRCQGECVVSGLNATLGLASWRSLPSDVPSLLSWSSWSFITLWFCHGFVMFCLCSLPCRHWSLFHLPWNSETGLRTCFASVEVHLRVQIVWVWRRGIHQSKVLVVTEVGSCSDPSRAF
jgi:hypothetical protein